MNQVSPDITEAIAYVFLPWLALVQHVPMVAIAVQALLAWIVVFVLHRFGTRVLARMAAPFPFSRRIVAYANKALRLVAFLLLLQVILRNSAGSRAEMQTLQHLSALFLIASITWLAVRTVRAISDSIVELNPATGPDNLEARRVQTQAKVLSRSVMVLILLIGAGMALSTLPMLRQLGTSLLASAGVAGLVVGFAAKPVLGNLLAGMQLAVTQPIRLDDVVIVQNEWGWIEEITGTYVVVRIWDQRRLIVPLQWFIENPFQNWTRSNAELLGTVEIWVDYSLPVEEIRQAAVRFCQAAPEWDGRLCLTQVIDASDRAMRLRVLVSAPDAGLCWDLRCRMREQLLTYINEKYPGALPRMRTTTIGDPHD
ncbi:MAG: mechanosensitive ion channel [Paucimonas sp.]|nr:mechanosensitive ion channel [Paucimonas sp.]